jgi:putative tricarboxylic transport membrane protein
MHGFRPGPYLIIETPHFVYAIFGKSSIRNLIAGVLGVLVSTVGVHLATGVE